MHPTAKEVIDIIKAAIPELDLSGAGAETKIKSELKLDSLKLLLIIILLTEHYEASADDIAKAETVQELCSVLKKK